MGMSSLAPSLTVTAADGKARTNWIGEGLPDRLWKPTPGLWFTQQSSEASEVPAERARHKQKTKV